jgi:hypothetical protein
LSTVIAPLTRKVVKKAVPGIVGGPMLVMPESGCAAQQGCARGPRGREEDSPMRLLLRLILLTSLFGSGCQFVCHIGRNLINEPLLACDSKQLHHRTRKLGKKAWNEMVKQYGEEFSCDYRDGFVDGFADYLYYGGCDSGGCCAGDGEGCGGGGSPVSASCTGGAGAGAGDMTQYASCPAVPPEKYRRKKYMTPEGVAAIEDWYAGFKHGAATAMASGLRNLVVLPVQCPPKFGLDDGGKLPPSQIPTPAKPKDSAPPMPPADEVIPPGTDALPPPRPNVEANPIPATPPPPPPGR